jgi:hypothetical protein
MSDPSGAYSGFPRSAGALLDRLASLYGLDGELERVRRVIEPLAAVPMETSVSLGPGVQNELRLTLAIPPRPGDPDSRLAVMAALSGLGAERVSTAVDEALSRVAPTPGRRRNARALAFRARAGEPVRPRAGAWVGGETAAERSARVPDAMLALGLDRPAALHQRLTAHLAANPFNVVVPYGLGFEVGPDRVLASKTYFACEWADVTASLLGGRLADELRLDRMESFELLAASGRPDRRRARWLMEMSFELPADPARGARVKTYLPPFSLAANEADGHTAVLALAARLGCDPQPYEELVDAVRPDGFGPDRPCSLSVGVSGGARGPSLEVYVLNPGGTWPSGTIPAG